jgi:hypothetical protein
MNVGKKVLRPKNSAPVSLKLQIELVPKGLWEQNLRSSEGLGKARWDKLRRELIKERGARCQICDPEAKVKQRRKEYPGLAVEAIKSSSSELGAESWKFLLGAYGNDSLYIRQLVAITRRHREGLTVDVFRQELAAAELSKSARQLAEDRIFSAPRAHLDYRSSRRMDRER